MPVRAAPAFSNPFLVRRPDESASFYNSFTPAYYVQYLRDLAQVAAHQALFPTRVLAVMAYYATEEPATLAG